MQNSSRKNAVRPATDRLPAKIAVAVMIVVLSAAMYVAGTRVVKRQREACYASKVRAIEVILSQTSRNASAALAADDILLLNSFVKNAGGAEGFLYAMVVNKANRIKAHSDPSHMDSRLDVETEVGQAAVHGIGRKIYMDPERNVRVLNLAAPVMFAGKRLGSVHYGISLDQIDKIVASETASLARYTLLTWLLATLALGLAAFALLRRDRDAGTAPSSVAPTMKGKGALNSAAGDFNGLNIKPAKNGADFNSQMSREIRDQVVVLSVGIRGFKSYSKDRTPEEILQGLSDYIEMAGTVIEGHGGRVEGVVGDVITGVFGSSTRGGKQSERAVRAAFAMQKAFKKASGNSELVKRVGMGISSGVALSGEVCSGRRSEVTFVGECFKVAYTLCVIANPGDIVVSKDVYASLDKLVSVEPLAPRVILDNTSAWENFRVHRFLGGAGSRA